MYDTTMRNRQLHISGARAPTCVYMHQYLCGLYFIEKWIISLNCRFTYSLQIQFTVEGLLLYRVLVKSPSFKDIPVCNRLLHINAN